ncbi:hypothetical protein RRG08_000169 [Elysia crispata]|uniref:Uncharacterized protein n=1 Tax=Elysia crispata TaxID=231223 RepID=A0AAE0YV85_9GAST|nr:hypothetical protein RRG08_000169 [Elysia crispata]
MLRMKESNRNRNEGLDRIQKQASYVTWFGRVRSDLECMDRGSHSGHSHSHLLYIVLHLKATVWRPTANK